MPSWERRTAEELRAIRADNAALINTTTVLLAEVRAVRKLLQAQAQGDDLLSALEACEGADRAGDRLLRNVAQSDQARSQTGSG